jgi:hypothetical protein
MHDAPMAVQLHNDNQQIASGHDPLQLAAASAADMPFVHFKGMARPLCYLREERSGAIESADPSDSHGPSVPEGRWLAFIIVNEVSASWTPRQEA